MMAATDDRDQRTLAAVTDEHIERVLASVKGNKTKAAKILGVDRNTLIRRERDMRKGEPNGNR